MDLVGRRPLDRRGQADPLLLAVPHRQAVAAREQQIARVDLGLLGSGQAADVAAVRLVAPPAIGVEAFLASVATAVCARHKNAEIAPVLGDEARQTRLEIAGQRVAAALRGQGDLAALIVERPRREETDGARQTALGLLGLVRLFDIDMVEQFGGEQVEVERTIARRLAAAVLRRVDIAQHFHAVQLDPGEVGAQAAQRDAATFARFPVDRDARQALQRLGQVQVWKGGDVGGGDRVLDDRRIALGVARLGQAGAVSGDHDFAIRRRAVRPLHGLILRQYRLRDKQRARRQQQRPLRSHHFKPPKDKWLVQP